MEFTFAHNNFNVLDLEKSLKFYEDALGLVEHHRKVADDGSFILVYLTDGKTPHLHFTKILKRIVKTLAIFDKSNTLL